MGTFLAQDQPGPFRPAVQVDHAGRLGHPGALPQVVVGLDRRMPARLGDQDRRSPGSASRRGIRRRTRPPLSAGGRERVRRAGRIRAGQQPRPGSGSSGRGRACSGSAANARSSTVMWSAAVFDPAFPARSRPASASPPATSGRSRKHSNGWNPNVFFHVAAAFSFSLCAIVIGGVEVQTQLSGQVRAGTGGPRRLAGRRPRRPDRRRDARRRPGPAPATSSGIDATGPSRSSRSTEHADPADRVRAVGDRDREVGEHPTRRMQPPTLIGVGQRRRHGVDQTGLLSHLPQQPDPGMRDHARAVRRHLDPPPYPLATLHHGSASPLGQLELSQVQVSQAGKALSRSHPASTQSRVKDAG